MPDGCHVCGKALPYMNWNGNYLACAEHFNSMPIQLQTLMERRDYLVIRIEGKRKLGWETQYDEREHRALCWALGKLSPSEDDGA